MIGMEKEVVQVLHYFQQFQYPPTLDELYLFLQIKATIVYLRRVLDILIDKRIVSKVKIDSKYRYTLYKYSKIKDAFELRLKNSQLKLRHIRHYFRFLPIFPQIKLIGLSGSVAMMNAKKSDDVDLFIITGRNRLWTGRFIAVMLAQLLGLRRKRGRKRASNKICLNLFFDERDLVVPKAKRSQYLAHEVLQMKPVFERYRAYQQFIYANRWVFDMFPNAFDRVKRKKTQVHRSSFIVHSLFGDVVEKILGMAQKYSIKKHQTTELVTQHQLWFHPEDFGRRIKI